MSKAAVFGIADRKDPAKCQETVFVRDTYRYSGRRRGGFEMHYRRRQCSRKVRYDGYCWQHRRVALDASADRDAPSNDAEAGEPNWRQICAHCPHDYGTHRDGDGCGYFDDLCDCPGFAAHQATSPAAGGRTEAEE